MAIALWHVADLLAAPLGVLLFIDLALRTVLGPLTRGQMLPLSSAYLRLLWTCGTAIGAVVLRLIAFVSSR